MNLLMISIWYLHGPVSVCLEHALQKGYIGRLRLVEGWQMAWHPGMKLTN